MDTMNDKAQILLIGAVISAFAILTLVFYLNTSAYITQSSFSEGGYYERNQYDYEQNLREATNLSAFSDPPSDPTSAQNYYEELLNDYISNTDPLSRLAIADVEEPSSHDTTPAWGSGQTTKSTFENVNGKEDWNISDSIDKIYRVKMKFDTTGGGDFYIRGYKSEPPDRFDPGAPDSYIRWEAKINDTTISITNSAGETKKYSLESTNNTASFLEGTVNGQEVQTYDSNLKNSKILVIINGDLLEGTYDMRFGDGTNAQGPCPNPCANESERVYTKGIIHRTQYNVTYTTNDATVENSFDIITDQSFIRYE